jgi:hypothetical protein
MAAAVPPAAPDGVSIQLRTAALAELLADRLRAAEFAADVDAAAREVRVALPGRTRALTSLLHALEQALADQDDGQARIRLDGRSYLFEPRSA